MVFPEFRAHIDVGRKEDFQTRRGARDGYAGCNGLEGGLRSHVASGAMSSSFALVCSNLSELKVSSTMTK
jgi:hypothetical protein